MPHPLRQRHRSGIGRILLFIFLSAVSVSARPAAKKPAHIRGLAPSAAALVNPNAILSVNRLILPLTPVGGVYNSMDDRFGSFWNGWSQYGTQDPIFDQGLCVIGKRNGVVGWLPYLWWSPYSPGPAIDGRPALLARPQDSTRYRAYGITYGDSASVNRDVAEWPADLGAPVDAWGRPEISGDQTVWMVYNGLDTSKRLPVVAHPPQPIGILPLEVRQKAFAHYGDSKDTSVWANTVFMEWSVYNRGTDALDSVYLSVWADLDFLEEYYDTPGIDTVTQTAYCWYKPDSTLASFGYTLLYGPAIASPGHSAIAFGKMKPGYRNLPLASFLAIGDDSFADSSQVGPPYSKGTMWNVVRGLTQRGKPIIDSTTHLPTHFPFSGDPVTGQGSIYRGLVTSGGAGFLMTAGPVTLAAGDSTWMMIAINPCDKQGSADAINRMREHASYLHSLPYDSLVARRPRRIIPPPEEIIPSSYALHQNYPNPFNAGTTISIDIPQTSSVRVEIFDVLGRSVEIATDRVLTAGRHPFRWTPRSSSGMYFYRLTATPVSEPGQRFTATKRMMLIK